MSAVFTAGTSVAASASQSSTTFTVPATAAGEFSIVVAAVNATNGAVTTPAGWTNIQASIRGTASTSIAAAIFYREWQAGDPATVAVSHSNGRSVVLPVLVTGADTTTFIEVACAVTQASSGATAIVAPTTTPTASTTACFVYVARSPTNGNQITWTPGANLTEVLQDVATSTATNASAEFCYDSVTPGVATGTRTSTASVSTTGAMGFSFVVTDNASGSNLTQDADDDTGLTDTTEFVLDKVVTDDTGLTDTASIGQDKTATDTTGLTDSFILEKGRLQTFTDAEGLTDTVSLEQGKGATDTTGLTDTRVFDLGKVVTDGGGLSDTVALVLGKVVADVTALTDTAVFDQAKVVTDDSGLTDTFSVDLITAGGGDRTFNDTTGLTDTAAFDLGKVVADTEALTDTVALELGKTQNDALGLTDTVAKALGKVIAEVTGLTDTKALSLGKVVADNTGLTDDYIIDLVPANVPMVRDPGAAIISTSGGANTTNSGSGGIPNHTGGAIIRRKGTGTITRHTGGTIQ
jgi:hypothetical protein